MLPKVPWCGDCPHRKLPHAPTPFRLTMQVKRAPRWEKLGDDADEKKHLGQDKLSLLEVRESRPTKPRVAQSTTSLWMCLPLARGSGLQLLLGQQQQLYIMPVKPKRPQEQERLLGH